MLSLGGQAAQGALGLATQVYCLEEARVERLDGASGGGQQFLHQRVTRGIRLRRTALFHLAEPVMQSLHQGLAPPGVVEQVVLQIGVALHHPDITQNFVEHACRAAGAPLFAQAVEQIPGTGSEQPDHDLPVGKRGVVVGNFAQARCLTGRGDEVFERGGSVHRKGQQTAGTGQKRG
jgi:hypothetical protein